VTDRPACWCGVCDAVWLRSLPVLDRLYNARFILCPDCGNKRCPKATHHTHACTGSNEPDQLGSFYGDTLPCDEAPWTVDN